MALNLKNPDVERLATEVARLAGETKTEAIRRALEERKARLRMRAGKSSAGGDAILTYLEKEVWPLIPRGRRGKRLTREEEDAILGFGPNGV
ncbi:MAG: type II toxin-antitoxin system VapB family antitoxin [Bryobacteraceae bacterium]